MKFVLAEGKRQACFCIEESALSGVRKIAQKVMKDAWLVTGRDYEMKTGVPAEQVQVDCIMTATIGYSAYLEELEAEKKIDLSNVKGKREVYSFQIIEEELRQTLVIAGSDKRGTIYGLFHLSELLGVSPWVYFADVKPARKESVILTEKVNMVSKEPSVKYRGFFINDEWPSFGNWTFRHFGGFTTEMYDHVFELLLRLKGNYLWPAMWTSNFSLDGPGFSNASLADEYGIVMSNSHHEPCLRHSEEWDLVRGSNSIYGNDWNFDKNKEGLTNYWRDGLKRNGSLENIITMGMRGERDSEILGHTATLKENIEYLKEVITTQNQLIRECVNEDLTKVPRMLALYKEVEAYFYGDEETEGLKDWKELDGITFMLCEDNFGNMRTLPTQETKNREGGWGMYYHFDYHGDPVSYEWVNSTYLPKVWEQMTMAYEFGIRDIWIVNVGDLKPQELPLSYFLDLAYDFDKYGSSNPNNTQEYTKEWIKKQFGSSFSESECADIFELIETYTRQNHISKPEALSVNTYHPAYLGKADSLLDMANACIKKAEALSDSCKKACGSDYMNQENYAAFYQMVYYPVVASMNQLKLMLFAGKNHLYAKQGRTIANSYAEKINVCIEKDYALQKQYHALMDGKWDGMMMSEHIGFTYWNDEECAYPVVHTLNPANKPRMVVSPTYSESYTMGGDWTRKTLRMYDFINPDCKEAYLDIANGSSTPFECTVLSDADWIQVSEKELRVELQKKLVLTVDRDKLQNHEVQKATLRIDSKFAHVFVEVYAQKPDEEMKQYIEKTNGNFVPVLPKDAQICKEESNAFLHIPASKYCDMKNEWNVLTPFGKYEAGVKAKDVTAYYTPDNDSPALTYQFAVPEDGMYEVTILMAPSNPINAQNQLRFGYRWNETPVQMKNSVGEDYKGGTNACREWAVGVLKNVHEVTLVKEAKRGINEITVFACDPAFVLEGIEIRKAGIH